MMGAAWVAGSVRARAMANRRLGGAGARSLAAAPSLAEAVPALSRSPYGRFVRPGDSLVAAQRGVAETLLWNVRVLAGWLPSPGVRALRLLAGWFELANIDERVRELTSAEQVEPPFRLGTLATAWPRLAATSSIAELRGVLASSPWGDPGGDGAYAISQSLRLTWADRVAAGVAAAYPWAAGAAALMLARDLAGRAGPRLPEPARVSAARLLGSAWSTGATVEQFAAALPPAAGWALRGVRGPADLWTAEVRWWSRVRADGARLVAAPGFGPDAAIGALVLLAADAWQVRAALEATARGPAATAREVLDALA
jgi:hypothetical protein